ncbi:MBL fold metallo-hydrolase [Maribacter confluentis]|uniref:MBL fold metallo-hydrolase n=1 Tax=Maribacter confluentis TaxID=1656093 RepID=A0ABT8RPF6_9FLAO|nr:MBL fold metallo-hydrolase [Maribacter confluentis]MDO1512234.1 MBL fold metallo-hydrolase [Maribacter confluentis]
MIIKQFQDKPLAHYSYAILSNKSIALIDPSRDPKPYYNFADEHNAHITAIFETHPHADFVSGHLQIHKETKATIYCSKLIGADYPHESFDEGDVLTMDEVRFSAVHTPGHSPDSISIIAQKENDVPVLFTGDTLFVGDVGRPDLREKAGYKKAKRHELAKAMFNTIKTKFNHLPDETLIYPAHGAGSLCGKNMGSESSSTLGKERERNWAFKDLSEQEFIDHLLDEQPFIPSYFGFDVDLNKKGAENMEKSIFDIPFSMNVDCSGNKQLVIDTRDETDFKNNHLPNSINIMARNEDDKIETWLGALVKPNEKFHLIIEKANQRKHILSRIAKIGYESQMLSIMTLGDAVREKSKRFNLEEFRKNTHEYTIVDIRNKSEFNQEQYFDNAINIPLDDLRDTIDEIPTDKPIVVHCAGGYRSAAGFSILAKNVTQTNVFDLSDNVNEFK